jgi:hypothetical protein
LEKAVGAYKATEILNRVFPNRGSSGLVQRLQGMEPRHVFNLIKDEHIQTITLVTSYLLPEKASELLALLRVEMRDQIIERLATLEPTPVEVVDLEHGGLGFGGWTGGGANGVYATDNKVNAITTLPDAVARLGSDEVTRIAMAVSLGAKRLGQEGPHDRFDTNLFPPAQFRMVDCSSFDDYDRDFQGSHQYYRRSAKARAAIVAVM